ncbi:MAG TPA: hypothetical protein VEA61_07670 [Allosphingosinicella sp.]|nr:hypothetical protein [Allosphingosinicella sp.]
MSTPIIAAYGQGQLAPTEIDQNLAAVQQAGWTTIILGLFHIGRPGVGNQALGDIVFNDPIVITGGNLSEEYQGWPDQIAQLKQGGSITRIYASVGGGDTVIDFTTIQHIYEQNNYSFSGTALEQNFLAFRDDFSAIDGIDLDCEDNYDQPSFNAFCSMLAGMGFSLTFCPYDRLQKTFWANALKATNGISPGAVKWWNLQCYSGGAGNYPQDWANAIASAIPGFPTAGFIVAGDSADYRPDEVQSLIAGFSGEPSLGGGFVWTLDNIIESQSTSQYTMADYVAAVRNGLAGETPAAKAAPPAGPSVPA